MDKKSPLTDWMISKRGSCLDIKVYLEALEAVYTAGFGEGVQVLFRVLGRHCEASKQLVIT